MATLPYVTSPGNIDKAFTGIRNAATPERVSQDFVKTILKVPGGSGDQLTSYLKKIGFTNPDGTPSDIYRRFRNPSTSGIAAAQALRIGYKPLYVRNEYMHGLSDEKLKGLIIEETGQSHDSNVVQMVFSCIKGIKKYAVFQSADTEETEVKEIVGESLNGGASGAGQGLQIQMPPTSGQGLGLNLSYTINLNLPATSDIAVFNAIFKSLKENLLKDSNG